MGLVTLSARELDRVEVIRRVIRRELRQGKAAKMLGLTARQIRRLCVAYRKQGPAGLASLKRGRPSNRRLAVALQEQAIAVVRERYRDFGPTLAHEKLVELHDVCVGRETLRKWMLASGLWLPRAVRKAAPHQPRGRRECFGELVQIDGCKHRWFEERGAECALLVYVDDATSNLMELRFVDSESAFDYFDATQSYLERHGKPVAFYSDKHSIFRAYHDGATGRSKGVTQFGRGLAELNIDIICANSPQAKGRVERMNLTLQDRLVKELRLRGISTKHEANRFAPEFMEDYNRRFGRAPINTHDAHRPLRADEDLSRIFTWQEERTLTANLVVHFKRVSYLVAPNTETRLLGGKRIRIFEREDGTVELRHGEQVLPYSIFDKNPHINQGAIVENKRLDAVLRVVQAEQTRRDEQRLASTKLTLRQKKRIRASLAAISIPNPAAAPCDAASEYLRRVIEEQKGRKRIENLKYRRQRYEQEQAASPAPPARAKG